LKVLRGDLMGNDMKSLHAKFCEFTIHIKGDMNLSLFLFSEFCPLGKQELRIFDYMKDVVLDEVVPTKFNSYLFDFCFVFYEF
jgi:hypothetical protein